MIYGLMVVGQSDKGKNLKGRALEFQEADCKLNSEHIPAGGVKIEKSEKQKHPNFVSHFFWPVTIAWRPLKTL